LVRILLVILTARDRYQLSVAYNYDPQLWLVKLGMVCVDICCQKGCSPKLMGFWMNGKHSLTDHKGSYMVFFDH
jgi:hypothetical protein